MYEKAATWNVDHVGNVFVLCEQKIPEFNAESTDTNKYLINFEKNRPNEHIGYAFFIFTRTKCAAKQ